MSHGRSWAQAEENCCFVAFSLVYFFLREITLDFFLHVCVLYVLKSFIFYV